MTIYDEIRGQKKFCLHHGKIKIMLTGKLDGTKVLYPESGFLKILDALKFVHSYVRKFYGSL